MSGSSKSRKLSVFDRLGPEEDLLHGSSSSTSRHAGYSGHKRERQSKTKHHRQSYEDEEGTDKFSQQQSSYAHQSSKDRHGGASYGSSHRYRKSSVEAVPSDSSECEDNNIKKEKYKKQYGEKELKEEYSKDKGKFKSSKTEKQLDINEVIEGFTDNEEISMPSTLDELDVKEKHTLKYDKVEIKDAPEVVDNEAKECAASKLEEPRSIDEVADTGERVKRFKTGKEKKRKHKVEKMKDEEIESAEDYDRQISVGEFDDQEYSSRGASKRKLGDNKASVETVKKKRPLEESSSYRERNSRTSSKVLAGVSESDRSREGTLWKPSLANESYKQSEASLDRYRDDRHGSARKTKSYLADDEYSRRGRDRERDRPTDGSEYSSRKRKRSWSLDASYSNSKRSKRGKKETDLYDSFSEEDMTGDVNDKKEKEIPAIKNEVDLDLLFLEEDDECLKDTANSAIDRHKPACIFLKAGISSGLCGVELYNSVSDIVVSHLQSQDDVADEQIKTVSGILQKNLMGLQAASQLSQYKMRNKLIKDVSLHSKAVTAQADLSIRNKLRKTSNNQRCFPVPSTELPPNWDSELYATGIELYKLNNNNKKSKLISSHCGTVVYM